MKQIMSMDDLNKVVDHLEESKTIYVIGSRLSSTFSYYLGWSLTKVRQNIHAHPVYRQSSHDIRHHQLSRFRPGKPQRWPAQSTSGKAGASVSGE
jgi:DNA-binding MurR/RpiR family transcriptional regulator